jgi:hypothetical protein
LLQEYKPRNKKPYIVTYDDGDSEPLDLAQEKWQLLEQPKKSDSAAAAAGKASKAEKPAAKAASKAAAAEKPAAKAASKAEKPSSKKAAEQPAEADSKAAAAAEKEEAEQPQSEEQEEKEEVAEPAKQQKKKPAAKEKPSVTEKPAAKKAAAAKSGAGSSAAAAAAAGGGSSAAAGPGAELVGKRVKVWWPGEKAWREGKVVVRTGCAGACCVKLVVGASNVRPALFQHNIARVDVFQHWRRVCGLPAIGPIV